MAYCVLCSKAHAFDREDAFEVLRNTPGVLREVIHGVAPETLSKKVSGKWSPRELLIHLVHTDYIYGYRIRQIITEKNPVLAPIDGDAWVNSFSYGQLDGMRLVDAFDAIRKMNLDLLQSIDPKLFEKPAWHPQYGPVTIATIIPEHLAEHDLNHLQQIRDRIRA